MTLVVIPVKRSRTEDRNHEQFGLMPEFIGKGLGKYFLRWTVDKAWSYNPRRFWLHTCTKDHPAALPNYLKAGFAIYNEELKDQG
jgi:GNAT superfamily N-acetyltransferase